MSIWTCGLATRLQTTPLFVHARLLHGALVQHDLRPRHLNSTQPVCVRWKTSSVTSRRRGPGSGLTTTSTTANLGFDAQESRCMLMVPLTTSFVTVGQWERRYRATAPKTRTSTSIAIWHILVTSPASELHHGPSGCTGHCASLQVLSACGFRERGLQLILAYEPDGSCSSFPTSSCGCELLRHPWSLRMRAAHLFTNS